MYDNIYEKTVTDMYKEMKENIIQMVINWTLLLLIKTTIETHNRRNINATHFANNADKRNFVNNVDKRKQDNTMNICNLLYK